MTLLIDVPENYPHVTQSLTLAGTTYDFVYTYNGRDERLRLSIYRDGELVVAGVKLMENQFVLQDYVPVDFPEGELVVMRLKGDQYTPATLGTIGIDKEYELVFLTKEEMQEALNNG